ncbi:MAG: carboxylate-amine ligase [Anaerolineaceae bacterium]|nr:carboxylate-amine ligase [Anaerolineaceae bacterium]
MIKVPLTLGVEEEYQIIDPETRELTPHYEALEASGSSLLGEQLKPEMLRSQLEVATEVCRDVTEVRQELVRLRGTVAGLAKESGYKILAASTHPFSRWEDQVVSRGERYQELQMNLQTVVRTQLVFGMHVHIGFGKSPEALELLVDVMNQIRYFLPHLLALSTSSPFWAGMDSGLKSYRSIIMKSLPRTGVPPAFGSFSEYRAMINLFGKVGSLGKSKDKHSEEVDATRIWWDVRPQVGLGTLEVRVCDICTRVDEALCIVALIQSIVSLLVRLREQNCSWREYQSLLILENKWRAGRYGIDGKLVDFGKEEEVPVRFLANEILELVDPVLDELGTRKDVEYLPTLLRNGTSADRQLAMWRSAMQEGAEESEALLYVVDQLILETTEGVLDQGAWSSGA